MLGFVNLYLCMLIYLQQVRSVFIKYNFSGASRFIDDRDGTSWQRSQGPEHSQASEFTAIRYLIWPNMGGERMGLQANAGHLLWQKETIPGYQGKVH